MFFDPHPRPQPDADLDRALRGPSAPHLPTGPGWYDPIPEAQRSLSLLLDALLQMPHPNDGPAQRHLDWAYTSRIRARQALHALPGDPTAPRRPLPAVVAFGTPRPHTGDPLADTYLPGQTRLTALRDDLAGAVHSPGCEDARDTATTVRNLDRCLTTYLTEVELGQAAGYLGYTVDNPYGSDSTPAEPLTVPAPVQHDSNGTDQ